MMKLVEIKGLDDKLVEAYKICDSCGFIGWCDICENERIFGKCEPRKDHRRTHKGKYRKTPRSQSMLDGRNLRDVFWGLDGRK